MSKDVNGGDVDVVAMANEVEPSLEMGSAECGELGIDVEGGVG